MKKTQIALFHLLAASVIFCSCAQMLSCRNTETRKKVSVKVLNWNLQTFFDASFDGNEYSDFQNEKSGWNAQKYETRLKRLTDALEKLDSDILVFEELEKAGQIYDITNRLNNSFNFAKNYGYAFFARSPDSSIGCAVLSRFPLSDATVHGIDFQTDDESQPSMRPIIQLTVHAEERELILFVNHWKSKSSGNDGGKSWRKRQEKLLARLMDSKKGSALLACGDFNEDISEFTQRQNGSFNVALNGAKNVSVHSPWIKENGQYMEPGSYYFQKNWERIDHFFGGGSAQISDFHAESIGEWADEYGRPKRFTLWNGNGWSDHLPVSCTVSF